MADVSAADDLGGMDRKGRSLKAALFAAHPETDPESILPDTLVEIPSLGVHMRRSPNRRRTGPPLRLTNDEPFEWPPEVCLGAAYVGIYGLDSDEIWFVFRLWSTIRAGDKVLLSKGTILEMSL